MSSNVSFPDIAAGSPRGWRWPAALLIASLVGSLWLGLRPVDRAGPVAVQFPPWWDAGASASAIAAAGGAILGYGRWPSLVVAQSADADFRERLRASGAWLLLDPKGAGPCSPRSERRP